MCNGAILSEIEYVNLHMNLNSKKQSTPLKKSLRIGFGIIFLVLGIAGLFLPILQGFLFIIVGLLLLAPYSRRIRRQIAVFKLKHPTLYRKAHAFRKKLHSLVRKN